METRELHVDGMTCGGCEQSVVKALLKVQGVTAVRADHTTGTVTVDGEDLVEAGLGAAIEDAGYELKV